MLLENIDLTGRVYYHVSPLPRFTANRSETLGIIDDLYNELQEELETIDDDDQYYGIKRKLKRLDELYKAIQSGSRAFGDNALIDVDSFYASSQPEYWMSVQEDELGLDYSHGGIYGILLKSPQEENYVPSGMGQMAPEVEIAFDNVENIVGPFQSKQLAYKALINRE